MPDEKCLIQAFFALIQQTSPHILVTYNGDSFDFPFVLERSKQAGLSMEEEIGFPLRGASDKKQGLSQSTEVLGAVALHMDCFHWVGRDSYLPLGSRGLKAVTREKLRYNPRELDPEEMTSCAATK